jgi:hypothetical protein
MGFCEPGLAASACDCAAIEPDHAPINVAPSSKRWPRGQPILGFIPRQYGADTIGIQGGNKQLVHGNGVAFEVEFVGYDGHTVALLTLERSQVRPLDTRDIPHARELQAAA